MTRDTEKRAPLGAAQGTIDDDIEIIIDELWQAFADAERNGKADMVLTSAVGARFHQRVNRVVDSRKTPRTTEERGAKFMEGLDKAMAELLPFKL